MEVTMTMLRSATIAGVVALSCVGMISQPADAQMHGGGFGGGHGGFHGGHGGFDHRGFGGNRFFFGFGFPGFGFGGYPYYPYYPAYYYPPYYPYYPPYPAYPAYRAYPPAASPATASPGATRAVDPATVLVQAELHRQGYDVGPVDGLLGPRTRTAIREYEQRNGLPVDGLPSHSLLDHMQAHPAG
jgi:Putative peptidoglycan binding domain